MTDKTNNINGSELPEEKQVEQSVWSVRINSQLLFKKAVNGRTILLGMSPEESKKVDEIMNKAIDELLEVLKEKTTMHEAPHPREQVTTVDSVNSSTGTDTEKVEAPEETEKPVEVETEELTESEMEAEEDAADEEKEELKVEKNKKGGSVKNFWEKLG